MKYVTAKSCRARVLCAVLVLAAWVGVVRGEGTTKPATQPHKETLDERLGKQLASSEPAEVEAAITQIKEMLTLEAVPSSEQRNAAHQCSVAFKDHWFTRLLELKRYGDIERIAMLVFVECPADTAVVSLVQKERVRAFAAAGKYDEALAAAKGFYNVCELYRTADAISLMAIALVHARSEEGLARRFRLQQAAGAATQPATLPDLEQNVLTAIKVDAAPFDGPIAAIDTWNVPGMLAKANLLLLAGRTKEARKLMREAYDAATEARDITAATEGVARAMRADDGSVRGANAFLASLAEQK